MRVRALPDWRSVLNSCSQKTVHDLYVSSDKEYVVYGLAWRVGSSALGTGFFCEIADDYGNLVSAPIDVFEIVNQELSSTWKVTKRSDAVLIWPDLFLQEFFFDDFSEGVPGVVEQFRNLQREFDP